MQHLAHPGMGPLIVAQRPLYRVAKRLLDIVGAATALIALAPVFAACALAVRRGSPGPIIFRQERVGLRGGTFTFLKFRSMYHNAAAAPHRAYVAGDLPERFGPNRVVRTPISENGFVGVAVGAAMTGMRPVAEIMFMDFMTLAMDQIVNHAAKIGYMYANQYQVPLVVRTPAGAGRGYGASHSQSLEGWLIQVPGLKVVAPSDPADAKGLLKAAIRDNNPVVFIENKLLYPKAGQIDDNAAPIPLGKARVRRAGRDLTLVSYGRMLDLSLEAADLLAAEGIECEVIDLRTLKPLDVETLTAPVGRTGRFVFVEEGTGGVGASVSATVVERCFGLLAGRPVRVAARDVPTPSSGPLEQRVIPQLTDIIEGCLASLQPI